MLFNSFFKIVLLLLLIGVHDPSLKVIDIEKRKNKGHENACHKRSLNEFHEFESLSYNPISI